MAYATTTALNAEIARAKAAEKNLQDQINALKPVPTPTPPPSGNVVTLPVGTTVTQLQNAMKDMTLDGIIIAPGTYPWQAIRLDVDRSSKPLTVTAGGNVIFDGSSLGSGINEIVLAGYVSPCKSIRFLPGAGRWQFKNYNIRSTGLVHTYEAYDFEFSGVDTSGISAVSGTSGSTEWQVYIGTKSGKRSQNLTFNDWNCGPTTGKLVGGFQSYQSSGTDGPDHVKVQNWKMDGQGKAVLAWGNGTDYQFGPMTITNCLQNRNFQNTVTGVMTGVTATGTTNASLLVPGITYANCSFDK